MNANLRFNWARLTANYWFYPALFSILGAVLAMAMIAVDSSGVAGALGKAEWFLPARPQGALTMLSIMAGSMIAVAATVFSITIAAVAYASGNYGPRLLTNFMEDRGNQLSLATLIGSFVYAVVVLRAVRGEDETAAFVGAVVDSAGSGSDALPGFVPQVSLAVAYGLTALCVAVLVFFLHHIPSSIRINIVLEGIGRRLLRLIRETYPQEGEFREPHEPRGGQPAHAWSAGYVQLIDFETLIKAARKADCVFSLRVRTGDFVHRGLALMDISGHEPEALDELLHDAFTIGPVRTPEQDPQFLIDERVEIALRALSPGINDPFTAINALHWLSAATAEIARRNLRKQVLRDEDDGADGDQPVIPLADTFAHYVNRGFGGIRGAAATSPIAAQVMLESLENAAAPITDMTRRGILREHGHLLGEQARLALQGPDLALVEDRLAAFERFFAP
ncbi:DUF2254 domain-containing protein [Erythrobacter sp.]|uniref:DUF2254 domain-containing protein n=1 Tax=Erythrobacter sp. TaxID=1042 RepID=UPI0025F09DB0|nr:DUF2254 domain-containing protein [Erythrobacter sp.]